MIEPMTPQAAECLAARTLAGILREDPYRVAQDHLEADRERVASDLDGLRDHAEPFVAHDYGTCGGDCPDARRYAEGLIRTAALYGVPAVTGRGS